MKQKDAIHRIVEKLNIDQINAKSSYRRESDKFNKTLLQWVSQWEELLFNDNYVFD